MWPWQSPEVRVKVSGLPARILNVPPWWRALGAVKVQVPGSFLRPVVLLGAPVFTVTNADAERHQLTVTVSDFKGNVKEYHLPYDGKAVLVGAADADLPTPAGLAGLDGWKEALTNSRVANLLMPPRGDTGLPALRPGDRVAARITDEKNNKKVLVEAWPVTVSQPGNRGAIVVPVMLMVPPPP
jgi:hypothetical protein